MPEMFHRIFAVDGSALHDEWTQMKVLLMTGCDCNGEYITIAVAIVPSESGPHVLWFLLNVDSHFQGMFDNPDYVMVSDRGSGLSAGV